LIAIDVNSSKLKNSNNIQDTAFITNLESCYEISRQLRFRNLSGLIVIDFIKMKDKNRNLIHGILKKAFKKDKSKINIGTFSKFGLLEVSRERTADGKTTINNINCNMCKGYGLISNIETISNTIIEKINIFYNKHLYIKFFLEISSNVFKYFTIKKKYKLKRLIKNKNILILLNKKLNSNQYKLSFIVLN